MSDNYPHFDTDNEKKTFLALLPVIISYLHNSDKSHDFINKILYS